MEGIDLTKGKLINNMLKLLIPLFLTNLLNSLYNIVDGIWIGKLIGEKGVSAITNCYPLILIVLAISTGLSIATSVLVSQFYGAKNEENLKSVVGVSYLTTIIVGITTTVIVIILSNALLRLLNTPIEIYQDTKAYLIIYTIGFTFNYFLMVIMESLRSIGNSKAPLLFVSIGTIINIVLDPILINAGLGVTGAAYATLISMIISTLIGIFYVNKKSDLLKISAKYLKLNDTYFKQLFKIGLPIIVENCCIAGVITFEVFIANFSGIVGSAAYGVISKLEQVVIVIGGSFKSIATVTVGQFIGSKKIKDSVHVFYEGLKLVIVPTFLIALIVFVFPRTFINIFVDSEKVIDLAAIYLSVVGFAHVLLPTRQFLNGFIVGTGHTFVTFSSAIIASICELILIFILRNNHVDNLKALGFGILTWVITEMTINLFYYLSNKWKKEVIKKEVIC